jgi:hypothetical protein
MYLSRQAALETSTNGWQCRGKPILQAAELDIRVRSFQRIVSSQLSGLRAPNTVLSEDSYKTVTGTSKPLDERVGWQRYHTAVRRPAVFRQR